MKRLQVLSAITLLSVAALTGCSGSHDKENVDKTKAQLTISTYEGGVGKKWLENAARLFEEANKDRTDFQEGRTGIQIHIQMDRTVSGQNLENADLKRDMYFTENVDYYKLTNQRKLMDITDILEVENPEDSNKTIISKIDTNLLSYMNRNNRYYAVPFYDCIYGLVYDKDLFRDRGFYLTNDGEQAFDPVDYGTGPNGVAGDWDDGLPKTYSQFLKMMDYMVDADVTPFTYSKGVSKEYTTRALVSWWSDYEGYEQTQLNFTFNGTAEHYIESFTSGNPNITTKEITKRNGYELRKQAGVYNALYFARNILTKKSKYYLTKPSSNYDAQKVFVTNKYRGGSNKPIGMLFEGTWWENEAKSSFDEVRNQYDPDATFNYGVMAIPKVDGTGTGDATFTNLNKSFGFINAKTKNAKQAKEFFQFLHTDAQLKAFTLETNMTRGLSYSFEESELGQLSSYAKDLMQIKQSEHTKIVYPYSGETFFINNEDKFNTQTWVLGTKTLTSDPIIKFISDSSVTAKQYFDAHVAALSRDEWNIIVG